jgi:thiosulfate reductase cytochrome b subunit
MSRRRHSAVVQVTHWITLVSFLALLVTGLEIVISHPRFYWGEAGNALTAPLFQIPIPASRHSVPTGYGFVLPDQNGWSRYLHFQAAWVLVLTGWVYVAYGFFSGHFRRELVPAKGEASGKALAEVIRRHLRLGRGSQDDPWRYNVLQRATYLAVIFVLFPMAIWTGLAMSPGIAAAAPAVVEACGGQQSARTIHFFLTIALTLFLAVHIGLVSLAGFRSRVGAMITGRVSEVSSEVSRRE